MLASARTFQLDGISARPVRIEVDVHRGLPNFTIVGLPDAAVRECRERVRAALVNCGFEFPMRRIVVNVAPASLRKAGPPMDLAIAVALLAASGQLDWDRLPRVALVGELALDGSTRPIQGALAMAEAARDSGAEAVLLPAENAAEAALVEGVEPVPVTSLSNLPALVAGELKPARTEPLSMQLDPPSSAPDLADLRGQPHLRRALEVAAAGGHSLLIVGPPGAGKALAASRLPSILPALAPSEALEVARIASATGRLGGGLTASRPFRAPHYSISAAGLIGGGTPPRPGEITLAHQGVLFLDQLDEFSRDALEALRPALETGEVVIDGSGGARAFPSRFLLVATANPCPCGRGADYPDCSCSPHEVQRYQGKLKAALADHIEIVVEARPPSDAEISGPPGEPSADVRARVTVARGHQERRLGIDRSNAAMTPSEARACALTDEASSLLADLYARQRLSGQAHDRALRLARTLADLDGAAAIGEAHMAEALDMARR